MKRYLLFFAFLLPLLCPLSAQNWDINTVHRVNSWDGRFIRNYNKVVSKSEPYLAVGIPVAMALAAWIKDDRDLLKDAVYVGTSVAGAFVVTYGLKYLVGRDRPCERYPDRVHPYSLESSPSFPSGHTDGLCPGHFAQHPLPQVVRHSPLRPVGLFGRRVAHERRRALPVRRTGGRSHRRRAGRGQCLHQPLAEPMALRRLKIFTQVPYLPGSYPVRTKVVPSSFYFRAYRLEQETEKV